MQIELKKVKTNQRLSQETHCFSADVWIDGVKAGEIMNAGHGGPDDFFPAPGQPKLAEINARIAREMPEVKGYPELTNDLELVVGDLVNAHITEKAVRSRMTRKATYIVAGRDGVFEMDIKGIDKLRQNPTIQVLNDMPITKAIEVLTERGCLG